VSAAASSQPPCHCEDAPYSRAWPARLKGKDLYLSVLSGRAQSAGMMAHLPEGGAWECRMRLPARDGKAQAGLIKVLPLLPGRAQLQVVAVPDPKGGTEARGYKLDEWFPLRVRWCERRLQLRFGELPELVTPLEAGPLDLEIAAQDIELSLAPAH
jgi:hypothetical protein